MGAPKSKFETLKVDSDLADGLAVRPYLRRNRPMNRCRVGRDRWARRNPSSELKGISDLADGLAIRPYLRRNRPMNRCRVGRDRWARRNSSSEPFKEIQTLRTAWQSVPTCGNLRKAGPATSTESISV